jgi:phosphoglycerate dehydrogenase-like enzyme
MENIVILDDIELASAQKKRLEKLGRLTIFKGIPSDRDEIIRRARDAQILLLSSTHIDKTLLEKLPKLKYIGIWATGYHYVDSKSAAALQVLITNVPRYARDAVAEATIAFMLMLSRKTLRAIDRVRAGNYGWKDLKGNQLKGKILGIVGTGSIGSRVAQLGKCFGMQVLATTKHPSSARSKALGVEFVQLEVLLKTSDYITLHIPLDDDTKGLIGQKEFALMKPSAFFVNTNPFQIVDQDALYSALANEKIAGAGLDDGHQPSQKMLSLRNVIITPRTAFFTAEATSLKTDILIDNIEAFLAGTPQNVVNRF